MQVYVKVVLQERELKIYLPTGEHKYKLILEPIHSNLCEPMPTLFLGGYSYYIIFIDDYSRKAQIFFLKVKESNEVLSKFKEFKELVENQLSKKIKTTRYNNGGEYTSENFKAFCASVGIKREYIISYNPQQNGIT